MFMCNFPRKPLSDYKYLVCRMEITVNVEAKHAREKKHRDHVFHLFFFDISDRCVKA